MNTTRKLSLGLSIALSVAGCEDDVTTGSPGAAPVAAASPAATNAANNQPAQAIPNGSMYRDEDFVEGDANRDPFRNFAKLFKVRPNINPQRTVLMATTGIDEMKLIAIITGVATPRAMLVDPAGVGHVVERGDYIGRAEVVNSGGSEETPVTLNWRVDRIRADEVVITREDPTAPNRPPLMRVIPLNPEVTPEQAGG